MEKAEQVMKTEMTLTRGIAEEEERVWIDVQEEKVTVTHPEGVIQEYEAGDPDGGLQLAHYQDLGYTILDVENTMVDADEEEPELPKDLNPNVSKKMLELTAEYIEVHAEIAELNKKMKASRTKIRKYMEDRNIKEITVSDGRYVTFQEAKATNSTARFTDYLLKDLQLELAPTELRKVTEIRINADKLDVLLNDTEVMSKDRAKEIRLLKVSEQGTARFVVKPKKI